MATDYDFRILIDTELGLKLSYGTGSFVSLDDTSAVLTTSQSEHIIRNMPSMSYYNTETHYTSSEALYVPAFGGTRTFENTTLGDSNFQFILSSIKGDSESGSIIFTANPNTTSNDYIKRYKFFGNKVCSVMGLPENYWIYSDKFRLTNTGSEQNYLSGDVLAQSVNIRDNFAISNAGSITSDIPFRHAKETDRWIKWVNTSGSIPTNDMQIGYSNINDRYEIRMKDKHLTIDSSVITASGDFKINGNITGSSTSTGSFGFIKSHDNLEVMGNISASGNITASAFKGDGSGLTGLSSAAITSITNPLDNRIITSLGGTTVNAEQDLVWNGLQLSVGGNISASGDIITSGNFSGSAVRGGTPDVDDVGLYLINRSGLGMAIDDTSGHVIIGGNISSGKFLTVRGSISASQDIYLQAGRAINFVDSTNTRIREINSDLELSGDENVILAPDENVEIRESNTVYARFIGGERRLEIAGDISASQGFYIGENKFISSSVGHNAIKFGSNQLEFFDDGGRFQFTNYDDAVADGDTYLQLQFSNDDSVDTAAEIACVATENHAQAALGTKIEFKAYSNAVDSTENPISTLLTLDPDVGATFVGDITASGNLNVAGDISASGEIISERLVNPTIAPSVGTNDNGELIINSSGIAYQSVLHFQQGGNQKWMMGSDSAAPTDFRIIGGGSTSLNNSNGIFITSSNYNVGIGTTNPSKKLTVVGDISASGDLHLYGSKIYGDDPNDTYIDFGGTNEINLYSANREQINVAYSQIIFNEAGNDVDIRIESTNNDQMFRLDAGRDKVGIGHNPVDASATLQVGGDFKATSHITASGNISASGNFYGYMPAYHTCGAAIGDADDVFLGFGPVSTTYGDDSNDANDQDNRIIAAYDGYVSHIILKANTNCGALNTIKMYKAGSGVTNDDVDQNGISVVAAGNMATPDVPIKFSFTQGNHPFSQGDTLAFEWSPGAIPSTTKADGVLVLIYKVE